MAPLDIVQLPCLRDNYGYLVRDPVSGAVASIDTPDAKALDSALRERGWRLTHILNTHHHWDHAGGNAELIARWGCAAIGPRGEREAIPGIGRAVGDGDEVRIGEAVATVLEVPGHTRGHVAYWFREAGVAFVGDTLFSLGCGRLFEGTAAQMWASLQRIAALPAGTLLHCAHEYTQSNGRFARSVDGENPALLTRLADVDALRASGTPTVPTTVALELATNPFLRAASPAIRAALGMEAAADVDVFAELRRRKDTF